MNERIEKLLAEAFFDEAADQADTKVYELNDAIMQKFAELIVKECIEISQVGSITEEKIKRHFGVKE